MGIIRNDKISSSQFQPQVSSSGKKKGQKINTKELINKAVSLPVEERAIVVDSLLRSLNPPELEIDKKWAKVAQQRLTELRSGTIDAIPGEKVFAKIWERFENESLSWP